MEDTDGVGPRTDAQLERDMARLTADVGRVVDELDAILRRASQTKQLPVLQQGIVSLRESVQRLLKRVASLAPPSSHDLRKQAKAADFMKHWSTPPSIREPRDLAQAEHTYAGRTYAGRLRVVEMLRVHGVKIDDIASLDFSSRIRLLLHIQAYTAVDFGFIPLKQRSYTQNETGRKPDVFAEAERVKEVFFKAWPKAREFAEDANKALPFSREALEACAFSDSSEERKKIARLLKDKYGMKMTEIVRLSASERVDRILAFQEAEAKSLRLRVVPEELKVQYHTYNHEDKVLTVEKRVCSYPGCSRERAAAEADALSFRPTPRVKRDVVTRLKQETPVASSRGLAWCPKHHIGYAGYCKDCHPDGDPSVQRCVCAYCGKTAQGNFAIHRDGFGEGPEVDLCDGCGACDETVLSCETIWEKFAKEGVCQ